MIRTMLNNELDIKFVKPYEKLASAEHGRFLKRVQILHDDDTLWNENGINNIGKYEVDSIRSDFDLI